MQPEANIDPLLIQNDERHETLKNVERTGEHQLMVQNEMAEGISETNKNLEHLLMQGDEQKNQSFEIEANDQNSLALWNLLRGPKGSKGDQGEKGDKGDNAFHNINEAIDNLKSDVDFQEAIKGEKGDQGEQGPAGMDGRDGFDGNDGMDGQTGPQGIQGETGEQGPKGERGLRGLKGEPGRDGKDVDEETVKELIEKTDFAVKRASKTVSLVELDDVNLSGLTQTNGKYNLGSGGTGGGQVNTVVAGAGITVNSTDPVNPIVTNSAPDQTVSITAGTNITSVTGTYPNFTINAATQAGGAGDVVGPASAVNNNIAVFDTTTGKLIKDGGATIASKQDADADLTALAALSGTGIAVRTGAGTWAERDLSYPAAGLTISNSAGIAGNPTFALANDLAAVEGLSGTGVANRTGTDTWTTNTLDTDGTLAANSDTTIATQKATKTYVDTMVAGLLDYRGGYDASVNTFPAAGGSGTAGAVLKGDMWIVSVAGTLGGSAVQIGDSLIASINTPGQTAGNWNILNANISYVPEDVANKVTTMSGNTASDTKYLSAKAVYDWGVATFAALAGSISQAFAVSQLEVGHASDTSITRVSAGKIAVEGVNVATTSSTDTFTNKTIIATTNVVEEITTTASSSTPAPTGGSLRNYFSVTALAAGATFSAPSGSPVDGNYLMIRIKDNGTARTLAWNAIYRAIGVTLPTTTVISKTMYIGAKYNSADSKWDVIAVGQEA